MHSFQPSNYIYQRICKLIRLSVTHEYYLIFVVFPSIANIDLLSRGSMANIISRTLLLAYLLPIAYSVLVLVDAAFEDATAIEGCMLDK